MLEGAFLEKKSLTVRTEESAGEELEGIDDYRRAETRKI